MGVLDQLEGSIVGLDTAPLIYFIERHPTFHAVVKPFFVALTEEKFSIVTSTVTLVETLTHPLRLKKPDLAQRYQEILLNAENLTTLAVSPASAIKAAEIRADYNLRTPDAIQLATAVIANAAFFLTNDRTLQKFPDVQVIVLDDLR
ncbi:MAG: type II toxin-antitoxin system VapC family toxin [Anaerolineae bacterium]